MGKREGGLKNQSACDAMDTLRGTENPCENGVNVRYSKVIPSLLYCSKAKIWPERIFQPNLRATPVAGAKKDDFTQARERFTARNVSHVTRDLDQPPPVVVTQKWAATRQKKVAPGKTLLTKA